MVATALAFWLLVVAGLAEIAAPTLAYNLTDFLASLSNPSVKSFTVSTGANITFTDKAPILTRNVTIKCATPGGCILRAQTQKILSYLSEDLFRADACEKKTIIVVEAIGFKDLSRRVSYDLTYGPSSISTSGVSTSFTFTCQNGCAYLDCGPGTCVRGPAAREARCNCGEQDGPLWKVTAPKLAPVCLECAAGADCCSKIDCGLGTCSMGYTKLGYRKPLCRCKKGAVLNTDGQCKTPEQALTDGILDYSTLEIVLTKDVQLTKPLPVIQRYLSIKGRGYSPFTIHGADKYPVLQVSCPPQRSYVKEGYPGDRQFFLLTLRNLYIRNGKGGGVVSSGCASVFMHFSTIRYCTPSAINITGYLQIEDSNIDLNRSPPDSAAVVVRQTLAVYRTRFSSNAGRAILIEGTRTQPLVYPATQIYRLLFSTFVGNSVVKGNGGAVAFHGLIESGGRKNRPLYVHLRACKFFFNTAAGMGGAIYANHSLIYLAQSNFMGNSAARGGAVHSIFLSGSGIPGVHSAADSFVNNTATAVNGGGALVPRSGLKLCYSKFSGNKDSKGTPNDIDVTNPYINPNKTLQATTRVVGCPTLPTYTLALPELAFNGSCAYC